MDLRIRTADPTGNITVFVLDKVKREDYAQIAAQLLEKEELHAEQVGFIEEKEDGTWRMQMMGGEFCGNASRSFGYLKSLLDEKHPEKVPVEVSGSDRILTAEVDLEKGTSRIQMPLPLKVCRVQTEEGESYPLVEFDGICHVIVFSEPEPVKTPGIIQAALRRVSCDACGVMYVKGDCMIPAVYVKETDSLIWESSCGSGTMGTAVCLSEGKADGIYTYQLRQPGGTIEAVVYRQGGKVTECKMGGAVSISEEICTEISWKG